MTFLFFGFPGLMCLECETKNSSLLCAEVKNSRSYTLMPPYIFMTYYSIKDGDTVLPSCG